MAEYYQVTLCHSQLTQLFNPKFGQVLIWNCISFSRTGQATLLNIHRSAHLHIHQEYASVHIQHVIFARVLQVKLIREILMKPLGLLDIPSLAASNGHDSWLLLLILLSDSCYTHPTDPIRFVFIHLHSPSNVAFPHRQNRQALQIF